MGTLYLNLVYAFKYQKRDVDIDRKEKEGLETELSQKKALQHAQGAELCDSRPDAWGQKQEDHKFKVTISYTVSPKPAWAT